MIESLCSVLISLSFYIATLFVEKLAPYSIYGIIAIIVCVVLFIVFTILKIRDTINKRR